MMVLGMTGYGRGRQVLNGRDISIEMKSVNSRYFEYSSRMPRVFMYVDDKIKKSINTVISRGKVEVSLQVNNITAQDVVIKANVELAKGYMDAINSIAGQLGVENDATVNSILRFNDIFTTTSADMDEEQVWHDISIVDRKSVV